MTVYLRRRELEIANRFSEEVQHMIRFLDAAPFDIWVSCVLVHNINTLAGFRSRHRTEGTNGEGLALDIRGMQPCRDCEDLARIFRLISGNETIIRQTHELIYAGPQVDWNVKGIAGRPRTGRRVPKYAQESHHDHVHWSTNVGTFFKPYWTTTPIITPIQEDLEMDDNATVGTVVCYVDDCPGRFRLTHNGEVHSSPNHTGDHFLGAWGSPRADLNAERAAHPGRRFIDISELWDGGRGYMIWATDGAFHEFRA